MNAVLLGEGVSDQVLLPLLRWVIQKATPAEAVVEWVDTSRLAPARTLAEKVANLRAIQPCDLLFVHRDADNAPPEWRLEEIRSAVASGVYVPVVPVRTTEAWLLFDEPAIRGAAGRPSGREPLGVPNGHRVEDVADPKLLLRNILVAASGTSGRRRERFDALAARSRVAELIEDWSPLRKLPAFQRLEFDTRAALLRLGLPLFAMG